MNASTSRGDKRHELHDRAERAFRWAEGFAVLADALETYSLPVMDLEEVRASVVARLREDSERSRREVERIAARLVMIERADHAAQAWHLARP